MEKIDISFSVFSIVQNVQNFFRTVFPAHNYCVRETPTISLQFFSGDISPKTTLNYTPFPYSHNKAVVSVVLKCSIFENHKKAS